MKHNLDVSEKLLICFGLEGFENFKIFIFFFPNENTLFVDPINGHNCQEKGKKLAMEGLILNPLITGGKVLKMIALVQVCRRLEYYLCSFAILYNIKDEIFIP